MPADEGRREAPPPREGQVAHFIPRDEFRKRFEARFHDPAFDRMRDAIAELESIAWDGYHEARKSPRTAKAGPGFADPSYDLSVEWRANRDRLLELERRQKDPATRSRVLVICGSPRNDGSCPGEMSKSFRLSKLVEDTLAAAGLDVDLLDLSEQTNEYEKRIHPCKSCVSTAMPLCHWPCSCYPNHAEGQVNDWMAEIYERWTAAHGVIFVTPVHWYQTPTALKAMIDRLVCADGGNPDPSSTHGKKAREAKQIELDGWDYPKHLAGRVFGVIVHGDVAGIEGTRRALADWLHWMGLIDAGTPAVIDRFIGYYEPYATSHETYDADGPMHDDARNVAHAVAAMIAEVRSGRFVPPDRGLKNPRPK